MCDSQPVSDQQLDDEARGFSTEAREHPLLKSHVVVPDVEQGAAVVLSSERRHPSHTAADTVWLEAADTVWVEASRATAPNQEMGGDYSTDMVV